MTHKNTTTTPSKQAPADPPAASVVVLKEEVDPSSYAQMTLHSFWPQVMGEVRRIKAVDAKNQQLPLARIKKIMKLDEDVKMISAEAPLLFAKAAEIFIHELTLMAWVFTEENKRRTLQRSDIAMALSKYDQFDFLIDIVPREEVRPKKEQTKDGDGAEEEVLVEVANTNTSSASDPSKPDSSAQIQYYLQLAQQQRQAITLQNSTGQTTTASATLQVTGAGTGDTPSALSPLAVPATAAAGPMAITATGQTIPLAQLLAQQQQQQQQNHPQQMLNHHPQIQFQTHAQPQQILTLSNGQQILVGGGHQQNTGQVTPIMNAGGQVIGSIPQQTQQQQFHIVQQIMSPTGEIQHIQVRCGNH